MYNADLWEGSVSASFKRGTSFSTLGWTCVCERVYVFMRLCASSWIKLEAKIRFFLIDRETESKKSLGRGKTGQFPGKERQERADRGGQNFPNVLQCRGGFGGGVVALQSEKTRRTLRCVCLWRWLLRCSFAIWSPRSAKVELTIVVAVKLIELHKT